MHIELSNMKKKNESMKLTFASFRGIKEMLLVKSRFKDLHIAS